MVKKISKSKNNQKIWPFVVQTTKWVVIFTFGLSIAIPLSFAAVFRNRVYPNIVIGNANVGGKTKEEALNLLSHNYENITQQEFLLTFAEKEWIATGSSWGIKIDIEKSVEQAFVEGRNPSIFVNIATLLKSRSKTIKIPLEVSINESAFSQTLSQLSEEIDIPEVAPAIIVERESVSVSSGSPGRRIDRDLLKSKVISAIIENSSYNISIPTVIVSQKVTEEEETKTVKRAEKLLPKKIALTIEKNYYDLKNQELISLLSFTGGFDLEKVASLAANLAKAFDTKPQNAAFKFEGGRVTVFKPGKEGIQLNQEKGVPLLLEKLHLLEATTSSQLLLNLPVILTPPEISTAQVNDLGIREQLSKGVSYFRGSIPSRVHNIILASSRLNGLLIKSGEIFSFNQAVGDISAATGYQQAYIIQSGRTILGDGGGVCQVSTTLFRAALNAGLPIIERTAHAYRVSYYEQGGFGPGLDATVFDPNVDLKFKNDTVSHILIQSYVNTSSQTLTFELYGSSDGRVASVGKPRVWDQVPPPPPRYEDDPTLPQGTEKQIDFAAWGAKAAFDYKVRRSGEVLINKTFYSNFRPWQAVYLRGTKQ